MPQPRVRHDDTIRSWSGITDRPDHPPAPDARLGRVYVNVPYVAPPPPAPPRVRRHYTPPSCTLPPDERALRARSMLDTGMSKAGVARELGVSRPTLYRDLKPG